MDTLAPIVLTVPDDDLDAPLAFALGEARRHGCGIRLVGYDEEVLRRVADRAHGVPTTTQVVHGPPVRAVLDASADARLVVVRKRDLLHLIRALTAADQVLPTTWTDPPVACVPPEWAPAPADDRPVTLGVEDPTETDVLVERTHDVCGAGPIEPLHAGHESAGAELVRRSAGSRLVVLGRNPADRRGGTRLGRTARAVLHESSCPVVMLPPSSETRAPATPTRTGRGPRAATTSGHLPVDDASRVPSPGGGPRRRLGSPARSGKRVGRAGRHAGAV